MHRADRIDSLGFMCAIIMFVRLGFFGPIFRSHGDVTITGEGLQIWSMLGTHGHLAVRIL